MTASLESIVSQGVLALSAGNSPKVETVARIVKLCGTVVQRDSGWFEGLSLTLWALGAPSNMLNEMQHVAAAFSKGGASQVHLVGFPESYLIPNLVGMQAVEFRETLAPGAGGAWHTDILVAFADLGFCIPAASPRLGLVSTRQLLDRSGMQALETKGPFAAWATGAVAQQASPQPAAAVQPRLPRAIFIPGSLYVLHEGALCPGHSFPAPSAEPADWGCA